MTVTTVQAELTTDDTEAAMAPTTAPIATPADHLVESDLLVEDVSIDGMCGVY